MQPPHDKNEGQPGRDRWVALIAVCGLLVATAPALLLEFRGSSSAAPATPPAAPQEVVAPVNPPSPLSPITPSNTPAQSNGLVSPTTPEQKAADNALPTVTNVDMNSLALQRLNAERKAKGLPPIEAPTAAPGHEINSTSAPGTSTNTSPHP
jgi:hypothetical protein